MHHIIYCTDLISAGSTVIVCAAGVLLPAAELESAAAMCAAAGAWIILDNTYEDFVYNGGKHHCVCGHNVLHVFSFSKAYGMMGWRVGYIAYPGQDMLQQGGVQDCRLGDELRKVSACYAVSCLWASTAVRDVFLRECAATMFGPLQQGATSKCTQTACL